MKAGNIVPIKTNSPEMGSKIGKDTGCNFRSFLYINLAIASVGLIDHN